ncbi:MAG: hypothetical protein ACR2K6_05910 [Solirubrobacterales bacterium]
MKRETLQWLEVLSKALLWGAGIVGLLSLIGAFAIASASSSLPVIGDIQRESRGILTIAALGGGFTAAGVLSGLGAILRLQLADRLERAGLGPAAAEGAERESDRSKRGSDPSDEREDSEEVPIPHR